MPAPRQRRSGLGERSGERRICNVELYEENARDLLAYAQRRVPVAEDAADLVAETYLIAWRRIGEVPRGDEARLWLYGVARLKNACWSWAAPIAERRRRTSDDPTKFSICPKHAGRRAREILGAG